MPQFTVFNGRRHRHLVLIGLRAKGSREVADKPDGSDYEFELDDVLFDLVSTHFLPNPRREFLGVAAQVKTNDEDVAPLLSQLGYVRDFLGGVRVLPISFYEKDDAPEWRDSCLRIGQAHVVDWIRRRTDDMEMNLRLSKMGSWEMSEDALSDLLALRRLGVW